MSADWRDAGGERFVAGRDARDFDEVLTKEAFDRMIPMAERWTLGVAKAIAEAKLSWHVTRLGCRAEYMFGRDAPKNGTEVHRAMDFELESLCICMP